MVQFYVGAKFSRVSHRTKLVEYYQILKIGENTTLCINLDTNKESRMDNRHIKSNYCTDTTYYKSEITAKPHEM